MIHNSTFTSNSTSTVQTFDNTVQQTSSNHSMVQFNTAHFGWFWARTVNWNLSWTRKNQNYVCEDDL